MKVDLHAHFVPRHCFDMIDREGCKYRPSIGKDASGQEVLMVNDRSLGPIVAQMCDPKKRIQDMDRTGVDMEALSIWPYSFFYDIDAEDVLSFSKRYNNGIAEVVRAYPDRFVGMATVPMQDVAKAVDELERAVLQLGFRAVEIASNINGNNLDEPELWPFYQKVQDLDIPILVHPVNVTGAERLGRHWLMNLIGNPVDTSIAIASVIFGGVLESFPGLKFIFSHAGGCAPFIRGRWEQGYQLVAQSRSIPKPPSEYLKLMYFDTIVHFGPALAYLVDTVGADKVVLGSDQPFVTGDFALGDPDPVATVRNAAGISAASKEIILEHTGVDLLKLAV